MKLKKLLSVGLSLAMVLSMSISAAAEGSPLDGGMKYYNFQEVKTVSALTVGQTYVFSSEKISSDAVLYGSEMPEGSAVLTYVGDKNASMIDVISRIDDGYEGWYVEFDEFSSGLPELKAFYEEELLDPDIEDDEKSWIEKNIAMADKMIACKSAQDFIDLVNNDTEFRKWCYIYNTASTWEEAMALYSDVMEPFNCGCTLDGYVKVVTPGPDFDDCEGGAIVYSNGTVKEYDVWGDEYAITLEEPGWYYACWGGGVSFGDEGSGPFYLYKCKEIPADQPIPEGTKYEDVEATPGSIVDITGEDVDDKSILAAGISNSEDELQEKLGISDEEKAAGVNVWIELRDVSEAEGAVLEAEKAKIKDAANGDNIAMYLDLNLYKQVAGGLPQKISNTNGDITISIQVPEEYRAAGREFYIIYYHGDEVKTVKPLSYDEATGILTFSSGEFSTYALAFKENVSPKTGSVSYTLAIFAMALILGAGLVVALRRRER